MTFSTQIIHNKPVPDSTSCRHDWGHIFFSLEVLINDLGMALLYTLYPHSRSHDRHVIGIGPSLALIFRMKLSGSISLYAAAVGTNQEKLFWKAMLS